VWDGGEGGQQEQAWEHLCSLGTGRCGLKEQGAPAVAGVAVILCDLLSAGYLIAVLAATSDSHYS
jgi:hypothetical protein